MARSGLQPSGSMLPGPIWRRRYAARVCRWLPWRADFPSARPSFLDAFLLGDGEEAVLEIAAVYRQWKREGGEKQELLNRLAAIEGVYVPSLFEVSYKDSGRIAAITPHNPEYSRVRRRFVPDLNLAAYPTAPVIPFLKTVHDRVSAEIARGCTR